MAINKVKYGNQTLIDLSTDTVSSAEHILLGKVGHLRDGTVVTGTASGGDQHGTIWQDGQGNVHLDDESGIALESKTVNPTESQQVIEAGEGYYALDKVTVGAISSSYVGSGVTRRSSSDVIAAYGDGVQVNVPAGYYASQASHTINEGSVSVNSATVGASGITSLNPLTGVVQFEIDTAVNAIPLVTAGYITQEDARYGVIRVEDTITYQLETIPAQTITPTTSAQTAVPAGKYTTGAVTVAAMPTGTAGTPTATKGTVSNHAVTVTPSVTNTTGYITGGTKTGTGVSVAASELVSGTYNVTSSGTKDVTNYASASVPAGTEGTPTATKGSVSNHSVSVTPSVTNTGGYIAGGTKTGTAVTVSASELVSGTYSITNNGQYNIAQYASVNVNVGNAPVVSENDPVRFFDYDGTLLYSYSASAFQALTAMPANPSHSGLTAQGWNWTLADAKAQLTAMGACDIGQMYVTDDGKTRLYCHFEEGRLAPYLGLCPNGTVTIDWGDNTATSTLTGTSLTSAQRAQHTYASAGDYVITLTATSGTFGFLGTGNGSYVLQTTETNMQYISNVYTNSIRKIELGTGAVLGNYSFALCYSLKSITIPNSVTSFGTYIFYYCYSLENIVVPNTTTTINTGFLQYCYSITNVEIPATIRTLGSSYVFGNCYSLATVILPVGISSISQTAFNTCYSLSHIVIPNTVTSFGNSSFASCRALANITIPNSVTTISTSAFSSCYCLGEIHFKGTTPPTVQNSNAFSSVPTDCKIYVPRGYLSAYTSATNYPSSATYTYVEE